MRSVPVQAGNMPRSSLKTRKLGDPALIGGLLNREKTAFRRDTLRLGAPWSKHVRCPKALPLSMLLRLQQTTVNGAPPTTGAPDTDSHGRALTVCMLSTAPTNSPTAGANAPLRARARPIARARARRVGRTW